MVGGVVRFDRLAHDNKEPQLTYGSRLPQALSAWSFTACRWLPRPAMLHRSNAG